MVIIRYDKSDHVALFVDHCEQELLPVWSNPCLFLDVSIVRGSQDSEKPPRSPPQKNPCNLSGARTNFEPVKKRWST